MSHLQAQVLPCLTPFLECDSHRLESCQLWSYTGFFGQTHIRLQVIGQREEDAFGRG